MSDSFQNDGSDLAKKRLKEASRTKDISVRVAWAITIGEAVLVGVVAVALMDYWLMLPVWLRTAGAVGIAFIALLGVARLVRFLRRPTTLKEAALDVEAAKPELGCEISTAAEYLSGERKVTREYEPELVAALEIKAAAGLGTAHVPYPKRLVIPAVILGLTATGAVLFVAVSPGAWTALKRATLPLSTTTYTQVQVAPGHAEVPLGSDLEITNTFSGRTATDPQVHWQREGETEWQNGPLITRSSEGAFLYAFRELRDPIKYRVTGGDAVSEIYEIRTYVPPEIKAMEVRIQPPDYTGLEGTSQKSPDIAAVRSSAVQIQISPSTELSAARLRLGSGTNEVPLRAGPDGTWSAQLVVTNDTDYTIELADMKGRLGVHEKPHRIRAIPDGPPTVTIETPGQDMRAAATNQVPITIAASDDFGVEEVELVFRKLSGPEQVITMRAESGADGKAVVTTTLDLARLGLKEFELAAYYARAKDRNSVDGPGVGQSPTYFIEVTSLASGQPQPQVPANKVNLLAVQKQLIADTAELAPTATAENYAELEKRQRVASDFAQVYEETLSAAGAPAEAVSEMQAAVAAMTEAAGRLEGRSGGEALPPEERALVHLYQVLKHMPQLEDLPTQPKPQTQPQTNSIVAVVLEAIREKQQAPPEDQAIQDALDQAEQLAQAQAALNQALQNLAVTRRGIVA